MFFCLFRASLSAQLWFCSNVVSIPHAAWSNHNQPKFGEVATGKWRVWKHLLSPGSFLCSESGKRQPRWSHLSKKRVTGTWLLVVVKCMRFKLCLIYIKNMSIPDFDLSESCPNNSPLLSCVKTGTNIETNVQSLLQFSLAV